MRKVIVTKKVQFARKMYTPQIGQSHKLSNEFDDLLTKSIEENEAREKASIETIHKEIDEAIKFLDQYEPGNLRIEIIITDLLAV